MIYLLYNSRFSFRMIDLEKKARIKEEKNEWIGLKRINLKKNWREYYRKRGELKAVELVLKKRESKVLDKSRQGNLFSFFKRVIYKEWVQRGIKIPYKTRMNYAVWKLDNLEGKPLPNLPYYNRTPILSYVPQPIAMYAAYCFFTEKTLTNLM